MDAFFASLGLTKTSAIGGFAGSVISLRFLTDLNIWQRFVTVLTGTVFAAYITPLAISAFEVSSKHDGTVGFIIGVFGMSIAAAVMKEVPSTIAMAKEKFLK